ncbi:MAG: ribose-phosphate diphosphokinase [Candidatus Lokiarchaeota archaeon]|jgi:ribose-phosphate pyrophosphokinase|nr:ribose-phosphate diphosphokinase [Candidatus Lokiarchaeota archaeon]
MEKILIVGPASQILGIRIAQDLNIKYFNTESKTFPDGENYLRINLDNESLIEGKEVIIVQSTGPSSSGNQNARLFELLMMIDAVKRMGAEKIVVVIPYLAYARQDKIFRPGESKFANLVLCLIDSMRIDELYVVDVHAPNILEEVQCKWINIDSMRILADYIKSLDVKDIVVVAPDKGAVERSKAFAKHFGEDVPVDYFEKVRDVKTGEITMSGKLSLKNKDVVVSDDIIATGGTMAKAIKLSKESGANKVFAVATHALLLQNAKFRIIKAGADAIIGTDSIDNEASKVSLSKAIVDYLK